jgi:YfiH family protein
MEPQMERYEKNGLIFYGFAGLADDLHVEHAIFTRLGGASAPPFAELNLGSTVGDSPRSVAENHRRVYAALDSSRDDVVTAWQVHGRTIQAVDRRSGGQVVPRTDGLITRTPGLVLLQRFADCLPLLFVDPVQAVIGLAHAGWRGTVAGIAGAALVAMDRHYGSNAEDVVACVGPGIGPCCYEIGADVIASVRTSFADAEPLLPRVNGSVHFDLPAANARQLGRLGVRDIRMSGICTACHVDEFFSHRAEDGRTGRFGVAIRLSATSQ